MGPWQQGREEGNLSEIEAEPASDLVAEPDAGPPSGTDTASPGDPRRARRRLLAWLAVAGLLGSLALVPYAAHLLGPTLPYAASVVLAIAIVSQVLTWGIYFLFAWLGLVLGERVGLGDPILAGWAAGRGVDRRLLQRTAIRAVVAGMAGGVVVALVSSRVSAPLQPGVTLPPAWQGFLASIGAGITEEMLCRLGLLTLFAWLGARLLRQDRPGAPVLWTANVLAGLLFAALHLPQAGALLVRVDATAVAFVLGANLLLGLIFGWLYERYGLLAAMLAHFGADLVLHVAPPLLKLT